MLFLVSSEIDNWFYEVCSRSCVFIYSKNTLILQDLFVRLQFIKLIVVVCLPPPPKKQKQTDWNNYHLIVLTALHFNISLIETLLDTII